MRALSPVRLAGIGHYLPETVITSADIEERVRAASSEVRLPAIVLEALSGVRTRRYVDEGQVSSDLAAEAAQRALTMAGRVIGDVDTVIFASASQDIAEPATANVLQEKLGCDRASVFDVKNACNSFLNGLDVAQALIQTDRADCVVVAAGEVLSGTVKWHLEDAAELRLRGAAFTLGDGGGAAVVERAHDDGAGGIFGPAEFESSGRFWRLSTVLGGGSLLWDDPEGRYFECDSRALEEIGADVVPQVIARVLKRMDWEPEDVDRVVPHQVSVRAMRRVADLSGIPFERCELTLPFVGNTAAASIPIALSLGVEAGRIRTSDRVLLVGGAAGFSAAAMPLIW
jgi:3-oxoacyl-(acyl-carrier-protein) synthase III